MTANAPSEKMRKSQRLIIGPWAHWGIESPKVGDVDFGPQSTLNSHALRIDWLGHWLKGKPSKLIEEPPVRIFVMGKNEWRHEQEWPLARTQYTRWYISDQGFGPKKPGAKQAPDRYVYDPNDPVQTRGGRLLGTGATRGGPTEQGSAPKRADIMTYTGAPLKAAVEITGPVSAEIWAATDAPDTDFTAKLLNVFPDGRAYNICDGIVRARLEHPVPLQKDAVYKFTVDMFATSIVIPAGNRLRVEISSSNYPMYEPNANSGKRPGTDTYDDLRPARQTVFHDESRPSCIILPIIPT